MILFRDDQELCQLYHQAPETLRAMIHCAVRKLDSVLFTESSVVPTLAVQYITSTYKSSGCFQILLVNRTYYSALSPEYKFAVFLHECIHICAEHGEYSKNLRFQQDYQRFITATEIQCNDILLLHNVELPGIHLSGQKILGFNTSSLTLETIFSLLPRSRSN